MYTWIVEAPKSTYVHTSEINTTVAVCETLQLGTILFWGQRFTCSNPGHPWCVHHSELGELVGQADDIQFLGIVCLLGSLTCSKQAPALSCFFQSWLTE